MTFLKFASQMMMLLFSGFWRLLALMYAHRALVIPGRESSVVPVTAAMSAESLNLGWLMGFFGFLGLPSSSSPFFPFPLALALAGALDLDATVAFFLGAFFTGDRGSSSM
eukprot:CAMPEP_0182500420 /NCGR_PEP_ID=MMETSP1321-20130603/9100_1 /TAXON_ID=91990 /ORGANISM="Bolidomonas sp., Strain RCC1657" /LENGTH=109 /DNA_ID=CAMNT_0024704835 /DNA_START=32 /DNA_END=361 /DNA_ORIENTATION=-